MIALVGVHTLFWGMYSCCCFEQLDALFVVVQSSGHALGIAVPENLCQVRGYEPGFIILEDGADGCIVVPEKFHKDFSFRVSRPCPGGFRV